MTDSKQVKRIKYVERTTGTQNINEGLWIIVDEHMKLDKENERYREALNKLDNWCRAYPLSVFPEPDFKKAHKVLKEAGMTLDAISASNMRHVVKGIEKIVTEALEDK
jgi:hypothetical protein